jgi:hypothetical protein
VSRQVSVSSCPSTPSEQSKVKKPWTPTPQQAQAAEYLAAGYSAYRTAQVTEQTQKQVWLWTQKPEFMELVADLRQKLVEAQRPLFENSVSIAQSIVTRRMTGEEVDDDTYAIAVNLLQRTLWRTASPRAAIQSEREKSGGTTG